MDKLTNSYFDTLNQLLDQISSSFIGDNLELIVAAINELNKSMGFDFEVLEKQDELTMNKEDVINITRCFFVV